MHYQINIISVPEYHRILLKTRACSLHDRVTCFLYNLIGDMIHTYYVLIYGTRNVLLMLQCNPKFESFPARTSKLPSEDLRGIIARRFLIPRSADFKVTERELARDYIDIYSADLPVVIE